VSSFGGGGVGSTDVTPDFILNDAQSFPAIPALSDGAQIPPLGSTLDSS